MWWLTLWRFVALNYRREQHSDDTPTGEIWAPPGVKNKPKMLTGWPKRESCLADHFIFRTAPHHLHARSGSHLSQGPSSLRPGSRPRCQRCRHQHHNYLRLTSNGWLVSPLSWLRRPLHFPSALTFSIIVFVPLSFPFRLHPSIIPPLPWPHPQRLTLWQGFETTQEEEQEREKIPLTALDVLIIIK